MYSIQPAVKDVLMFRSSAIHAQSIVCSTSLAALVHCKHSSSVSEQPATFDIIANAYKSCC
jgi:hypothetical protein